jgi:SAM-dependent methyltransferase
MPRTDAPHRYAIRGGKQGKERLDVLARVLLPTTTQLFDRAGLIKGMKCLDVGCGGGHVAMLIAGIVGPEGLVIATDTDPEILALAREDAEAAKITNVKFQQLDAYTGLWAQGVRSGLWPFFALALARARKLSRSHGGGVCARRNYRH